MHYEHGGAPLQSWPRKRARTRVSCGPPRLSSPLPLLQHPEIPTHRSSNYRPWRLGKGQLVRETQPLGCARADRSPAAPPPPSLPGRQRQPPGSPGGRAVRPPANCSDGSRRLAWGQSPGGREGAGSCNSPPLGGGGERNGASLPVRAPAPPTACAPAPAFFNRQAGGLQRRSSGRGWGRGVRGGPLTASRSFDFGTSKALA